MPERIPFEAWQNEHGHVERYRWAARYVQQGDSVLDIACGIGYGSAVLQEHAPEHSYLGVDKLDVVLDCPFVTKGVRFLGIDIDEWEPRRSFDVAVCFETLEHVGDLEHLIGILTRAERTILVSVPVVPTVGMNPWHVRDFAFEDIPPLFEGWQVVEDWPQPSERSHVWAFAR